jgi:alanyl-tRNA synthetase
LKTKPAELVQKALQESQEIRELRHAVESFKAKEAVGEASNFLMGAREVGGLKVLTSTVPDADADRLRKMGDFLRDKDESVVAVLAAVNDGKITFLAACGKDAVAKGVKAGDIIKAVAPICGGKGGGKPDSAMGGGSDVLKLDNALATVDDFVSQKLGL